VIAKNAISSNKEDNNLPRAANVSTPNKLDNSEKYFNEKVLIFAVSRMQISQKKTSNLPGKMSINHGSAHHGTAPSNAYSYHLSYHYVIPHFFTLIFINAIEILQLYFSVII
jgi:hypothetical protein